MQRVKLVVLALLVLGIIQTVTYFTVAPGLLKYKLLTNSFQGLTHYKSDSAFVIDYVILGCLTTSGHYSSPNLKNDADLMKEKLGVKYIRFAENEGPEEIRSIADNYRLCYQTWRYRPSDWSTLFHLFRMKQEESVSINNEHNYHRVATYHWCLFFWLQTFEYLGSWTMPPLGE